MRSLSRMNPCSLRSSSWRNSEIVVLFTNFVLCTSRHPYAAKLYSLNGKNIHWVSDWIRCQGCWPQTTAWELPLYHIEKNHTVKKVKFARKQLSHCHQVEFQKVPLSFEWNTHVGVAGHQGKLGNFPYFTVEYIPCFKKNKFEMMVY
jgi:hypothetical protein